MTDILGRQPTPGEQLLIDDVETLAPSKTLERYDNHAKFIFANVGIIATLLTAFELIKPEAPSLFILLPLALAGASLAFAAFAITPKYDTVNIADLRRLRAYYVGLLQTRGFRIRAAGTLFALALLSAPFAFNQTPLPTPIASASSVKVTRAAGVSDTASIHVELANVPPSSTITTRLCLTASGETRQLATHESLASGAVKLDIEQPIPAGETVTVTTTVTRPGDSPYTETTTAHIPPQTGGTDGNEENQGSQETKGSQSEGSGRSKGNR